jgi:SIR2-like domain
MISWPDHLVEEVARRRAVLFLGSGVSRQSVGNGGKRPPLWVEFLETGAGKCKTPKATRQIRKCIKAGDLLTACELLKESVGVEWDGLISSEFVDPHYAPSKLHELVFRLDVRLVVTQNFDRIYDTLAAAQSHGTVFVKSYTEADTANFIRRRQRLVLKAHGSIEKPAEMVFTRGDYARARHAHAGFHSLLDGLLLTHTCLFLGCGLNDPDIAMMLERAVQLHPSSLPHYIAMGSTVSSELKTAYKRTMNLEVLPYSPADNHVALTAALESLVTKVDSVRDDLSNSRDW